MSETQAVERGRRRRSRGEAERLVLDYERSGMTRVAFCRQHGLSAATLDNYRKRCRADVDARPAAPTIARTYESRGEIVRRELGSRDAEAFTPQDLETWLSDHCRTSATFNRYKALVSLAYRQGIRNKKVTVNPARLIPQRKEPKGRLRFLSREEPRLSP